MELKGAAAIVTGGTGGLGRRVCAALAKEGTDIVLVYNRSKAEAEAYAKELAAECGVRVVAHQADITAQADIDAMIARCQQEFGKVDILVNDAAYNRWIPFSDLETMTPEVWEYIQNYNVTAPFRAMRSVGPIMKKQGQGRIVNITSVAGLQPTGSSMAYATSKAALIHLSRCMAVGLAPEVIVNSVAPGLMDGTRMTANLSSEYAQNARQSTALKRSADKDDVADAVVLFCRTDSITGQTLVVDSGRIYH